MSRKLTMWLGGAMGLLVVLLLTGFVYQSTASAADQKIYPAPGELVDVDGHQMHLYCIGTGSPTVVLESGLGETMLNWTQVQAETAAFARVCSYDRVGFGWSEPVNELAYSPQVASSLHELLKNADIPAPYLLVGHSIGGIHVRNFAHQFPDEVAGIVLVDSSHDSQRAEDPDEGKNPLLSLCRVIAPFGIVRMLNLAESGSETNPHLSPQERQALIATMNRSHYCQAMANEEAAADVDMSQQAPKPLGDVPLTVLTATQSANRLADELPASLIEQVNALWAEKQLDLVALSSNSSQVLATESAHYIQYEQPELVVEAIRDMIGK
jgi:pimeloyl-ACP methyl ester carboxylesterase